MSGETINVDHLDQHFSEGRAARHDRKVDHPDQHFFKGPRKLVNFLARKVAGAQQRGLGVRPVLNGIYEDAAALGCEAFFREEMEAQGVARLRRLAAQSGLVGREDDGDGLPVSLDRQVDFPRL